RLLRSIFQIHFRNSNTLAFSTIINSYFSKPNMTQWTDLLKQLPTITYENYFYSNFFFLPFIFAALVVIGTSVRKIAFALPETALLVSGLGLFLFLNVAPPYPGWQMRGM